MKRNFIINELQKKIDRDTKIYKLAKIVPYSVKEVKKQLSKFNYSEIEVLYKIVCMGYDYDQFREIILKKEINLERLLVATKLHLNFYKAAEAFKNTSITFFEANKAIAEKMAKVNIKGKDNEN